MIANALFNHSLAYFAEYPLKLNANNGTIYPDFTILHPKNLTEIYWEHFGMMDDPIYATDACRRIQLLNAEGITIGHNLICTFETLSAPLSSMLVESFIKQFFRD